MNRYLCVIIAMVSVLLSCGQQKKPIAEDEALEAMKKATRFMMDEVSYNGGFVWNYLPDMSRRWGELEAYPTMMWIQPLGTPSMGHIILDAYHATNDEYYYESAVKIAVALIQGQLPCGGWNYMYDFAGEDSLKKWYDTIGKNAWRLEEFQHYYGNATFDDEGTIIAAKYLLRMYVEKKDPTFREPLDKAINLVLESQYPNGGWPQRYPLMYDHSFKGKADYTSFITLNDFAIQSNIEFLLECSIALDIDTLKAPIEKAMNLLVELQQEGKYPGWADQYFVETLKPAHGRSYEPLGINSTATLEAIELLTRCYRLTGDKKYIAGIPKAIAFLESLAIPKEEAARYWRPLKKETNILVPRYIDPETGKPLYVHRKGSNAANGTYFANQDITNTVVHAGTCVDIDINAVKKNFEYVANLPANEVISDSSFINPDAASLQKYYMVPDLSENLSEEEVTKLISELTPEGYWLTTFRYYSNPYIGDAPKSEPSNETKYASTRVGDEYDTSCFESETPIKGIATSSYIANMAKLISFIESEKKR